MARQLRTSRSQLDRLMDPQNVSVTLDTITRAAKALGKRVIIRVTDINSRRHGRGSAAGTKLSLQKRPITPNRLRFRPHNRRKPPLNPKTPPFADTGLIYDQLCLNL